MLNYLSVALLIFLGKVNMLSCKHENSLKFQDLDFYIDKIKESDLMVRKGKVKRVVGLTIESEGPTTTIGDLCKLKGVGLNGCQNSENEVLAEVVGFRDERVLLMPLGDISGIGMKTKVYTCNEPFSVKVGDNLLGRVVDALGGSIDNGGEIRAKDRKTVSGVPINPMERQRIDTPIGTGIRAIDGLIACGKGQRIGIFAGSGVGKSVLMGIIAKQSEADVNVIGLVGERGREVREFIENDLGEEGLKRSVVVVATSDQPALVRREGAYTATAIAEYFRDRGKNVMLMIDSITRFAMAQREIGLAVGEPPTSKGYTPSVFAQLPLLMERAGNGAAGSGTITALYTVLVDADDFNEPISDAARSILDGHIILSRDLASKGHYPAIDILASLSRLMNQICDKEHIAAAQRMRRILAVYKDAEYLINLGAYVSGSNKEIDYSVEMIGRVKAYLQQSIQERTSYKGSIEGLYELFN